MRPHIVILGQTVAQNNRHLLLRDEVTRRANHSLAAGSNSMCGWSSFRITISPTRVKVMTGPAEHILATIMVQSPCFIQRCTISDSCEQVKHTGLYKGFTGLSMATHLSSQASSFWFRLCVGYLDWEQLSDLLAKVIGRATSSHPPKINDLHVDPVVSRYWCHNPPYQYSSYHCACFTWFNYDCATRRENCFPLCIMLN